MTATTSTSPPREQRDAAQAGRARALVVGVLIGATLGGACGYGIARATEPDPPCTSQEVAMAEVADSAGLFQTSDAWSDRCLPPAASTDPAAVDGPQDPDRDGTYIVGPGVWRAPGGPDCEWLVLTELPVNSFLSMAEPDVLNRGGGDALQAARIDGEAGAFVTTGCGPWTLL